MTENPYVTPPSTTQDPAAPGGPSPDERQFAMFTHLSALAMVFGIPSFIGPLVLWLIKKDTMPFVDDQGKEALNFNLNVLIYGIIFSLLIFVLIGFLLLPALAIFWLVFTIIATIKANEGVPYRYPLTFRLIR